MANPSRCEALFDEWYGKSDSLDPDSFEELCRAHPDCEESFRESHSQLKSAHDALGRLVSGTKSDSINTLSSESWGEFLEIARRFGPPAQRYALGALIGEGGMGRVLEATDPLLRRKLVLKFIKMRGASSAAHVDSRMLGRFLDEAQITAALDHPYIVPIHDLGIDRDGSVYFAMKRVFGEDFGHKIDAVHRNKRGWSMNRALQVVQKVCEAMAYAHSKNVVHRDLKPGNIMIGQYGEVYVMDWGIARVLDQPDKRDIRVRLHADDGPIDPKRIARRSQSDTPVTPLMTMDGEAIGTPAYMPPEQAHGNIAKIGPRSDIYAVGAILYHLACGHPPYVHPKRKQNNHELLALVRKGPPPPIASIQPLIPPALAAIIEKAMARKPEGRYPSMLDLSEDLQDYMDGRVVGAHESGLIPEIRSWVKRNRGGVTASVAIILIIASLCTLMYSFLTELDSKDTKNTAQQTLLDALATRLDLEKLIQQEQALWPATRENEPLLNAWLAKAYRLIEQRPLHLQERDDVAKAIQEAKERATSSTSESGSSSSAPPGEAFVDVHGSSTPIHYAESYRSNLDSILKSIDQLRDPVSEDGLIRQVDLRWKIAQSIERETLANKTDEWRRAIETIANSPRYARLRIEPTLGLVPLGEDPHSGLYEFWHWPSGTCPKPNNEGSRMLSEGNGMVFVLVPGGRFLQGAQSDRENAPGYDPYAEIGETNAEGLTFEARTRALFVSKFEWTQGQWLRLFGSNPARYSQEMPDVLDTSSFTLLHPVESISWRESIEACQRLGFDLPTETEWEYFARAGTTTAWWSGSTPDDTVKAGQTKIEHALEDRLRHVRVGTFAANSFGLHDIIGNCGEWCLDVYDSSNYHASPEGPFNQAGDGALEWRVIRGGSFFDPPSAARSAKRNFRGENDRATSVGVRPVIRPTIKSEQSEVPAERPVLTERREPTVRTPAWAEALETKPDPEVVTNPSLRTMIEKSGYPWRVQDKQSGIELVLIPAGVYIRGASPDDPHAEDAERPAHSVTISKPFYIGRHEVTREEWCRVLGIENGDSQSRFPAVYNSFQNVQNFLAKTNNLRLPTEAEWEYAARAGTKGPSYDDLRKVAWCGSNSDGHAHEVGGKLANGFGTFDMLGNVWEMCGTEYYDNEYALSVGGVTDPGIPATRRYVLRGGSFNRNYRDESCRVSVRLKGDVSEEPTITRGFRVARNVE